MGGQAEGQATETAVRVGAPTKAVTPTGAAPVGVAVPTEAAVATGAGGTQADAASPSPR